jgi:hypothetical protein
MQYIFTLHGGHMTDLEIAYLAGYIDGDGCFYMDYVKHKNPAKRPHHRCVLKFASVTHDQIKWISELFGFDYWMKSKTRQQRENPNRKPVYECNVTGEKLDFILPLIYPFLKIKKQHCEIMMNMRKTYTHPIRGFVCVTPSDELYELRHKYYLQLRSINTHQNGKYRTCPLSP